MMLNMKREPSRPLSKVEQGIFLRLLLRLSETAPSEILRRNGKSLFNLLVRARYR